MVCLGCIGFVIGVMYFDRVSLSLIFVSCFMLFFFGCDVCGNNVLLLLYLVWEL